MDINQTIINVINTLNGMTVSGRQNMERVLGSIQALELVLKELDKEPEIQVEAQPE